MPYRKKRNTCKKPRKRNTRGKPRKRITRGKPRKRNTRMKTGVKSKIRTKGRAGMWRCPARPKPPESKRTRKERRNRMLAMRQQAALEDAETLAAEVLEADRELAAAKRASLADKERLAAQARELDNLRAAASSGKLPVAHVTPVIPGSEIEAPSAAVPQLSGAEEAQRARNQRVGKMLQPEPEPEPEPDLLAGDDRRIELGLNRLWSEGQRPGHRERKGRRRPFKVGDNITWYSPGSEYQIDGEVVSVNGDGTLDLRVGERYAAELRAHQSHVLHKA